MPPILILFFIACNIAAAWPSYWLSIPNGSQQSSVSFLVLGNAGAHAFASGFLKGKKKPFGHYQHLGSK
ncbi:hypothetical protein V8C42DRAFT_333460 [Trichoderma barbatum]